MGLDSHRKLLNGDLDIKIGLAPDLHTEFFDDLTDEELRSWFPDVDVVVLAGDCAKGDSLYDISGRVTTLTDSEVVVVAGNHEFYHPDIYAQNKRYRELFQGHPRLHYTEKDRVDIAGVTFLGTTLWTNFDAQGSAEYLSLRAVSGSAKRFLA
ncbi:hypothetical protein C0029_18960 [Halioglobus japonicus]|uniref:Calcineurin-like phosphoesterase domain-containing protein n=1 Tax=Halioglobus japonicus TaxID=930805 RepID=A0AAP8MBB7_9GAMM|nr:hypothetical protein C0029_18960 [Halioglobus japonicus]